MKIKNRIGFFLLLIIWASCISACSTGKSPVFEPSSSISGYKIFQGDTEGLMFSFEYPEGWQLTNLHYGNINVNKVGVGLFFGSDPDKQSDIAIESMPSPYTYPPAACKNAHDLLQKQIWMYTPVGIPTPDLVEKTIKIGGTEAEEVDFSANDYHAANGVILRLKYRHVAVDYKGRIYWIHYQVNTNVDSNQDFEPGFEHILETFKFLN
jgi:hypothetical protein